MLPAATAPPAVTAPVVRPAVPSAAAGARYVRLRLDVTTMGISGHGEILIDRTTGAFLRRFDAGPVSDRDGWDGTDVWHADATGMPRIEGNADERAVILTWARLFAAAAPPPVPPPSRPPDVTVDRARDETTAVTMHVGPWTERVTFAAYRVESGVLAPTTVSDVSVNGAWTAHVVGIETPRSVPATAFAPPPAPDDATLHGVSTIPIVGDGTYPIVSVAIDGTPMRFLIDTGGQNAISTQAARRAHLDVVGSGTVSGVGTALATTAFATVRAVRVGDAEMRDQPFYVLDLGNAPIDGIVGYELLARFAARIDLQHARVQLAREARALTAGGVAVRMTLDDRQPQVEGALDGIPGTMTIDTGSAGSVDVESPFVAAHDLRARLHGEVQASASGVGGAAHGFVARAHELRLGAVVVPSPAVFLADDRAGGYADPTIAANVGNQVLRHFAVLFDYRDGTIRFEAPGS